MPSEEKIILSRIVESFARSGSTEDKQVKVTSLPKGKTSHVEYFGGDGHTIMLDEYRINGKIIWAGYSTRSGTVYLSSSSG